MSGESFGGVAVIAAVPVVIAGATIYGIASVVKAIAEQEKASREAQRLRIEKEAAQFRAKIQEGIERESREIEERQKKRAELQAEKEREKEQKDRLLKEIAKRGEIAQKVSKMAMSKLDAAKQNLNNRIDRLINETSNIRNNALKKSTKDYAELLKASIKNATDTEIIDIEPLLEKFSSRLERIKQYGYDPVEKEKAIKEIIDGIETEIEDLPKSYAQFISDDISEIKQSISEIREKLEGNYAFYESILKGIKLRTREVISMAKKKWEHQEKLIESIGSEIKELLIDIECVVSSSLVQDKTKAIALRTSLNNLYAYDVHTIKSKLQNLAPEIKKMYMAYIELEKLDRERHYIMNSVHNILTDMGYEVSAIPSKTLDKPEAPLYAEFTIPGGEAVRLGFDMNKNVFAEVFHPETGKSVDSEKLRTQEKKWCSDIDKVKAGLKEKGLIFNEEWRRDFTDEDIERIEKESQETTKDKKKEEEYIRRTIQEQRRMKT
jgi:hypothetical protein